MLILLLVYKVYNDLILIQYSQDWYSLQYNVLLLTLVTIYRLTDLLLA